MGPQRSSVVTSFYRKLYPKDPDSSGRGHMNLGKAAEECDLLIWALAGSQGCPSLSAGDPVLNIFSLDSPQVSQTL